MNRESFLKQCIECELILRHMLNSTEIKQFDMKVVEAVLSHNWLRYCKMLNVKKEDILELVNNFYDNYVEAECPENE